MLARWFRNKELAFSFGVTLTISRLGSLFAFNTGELISRYFGGFRFALLAAVLACGLSLLGNILYALLDKRGEKVLNLKNESAAEKINLKEVKNFKPTFWYTTALCFTFYSAIFPFTALSTDFFVDKWGIARAVESSGGFLAQVFNNFLHLFSTAGGISSIIIFASMIFAPLAGGLIDRLGRRASFMVVWLSGSYSLSSFNGSDLNLSSLSHDFPGTGFCPGASGSVAIGSISGQGRMDRNSLWSDDCHSEYRFGFIPAAQWLSPGPNSFLYSFFFDVCQSGVNRIDLLLFIEES